MHTTKYNSFQTRLTIIQWKDNNIIIVRYIAPEGKALGSSFKEKAPNFDGAVGMVLEPCSSEREEEGGGGRGEEDSPGGEWRVTKESPYCSFWTGILKQERKSGRERGERNVIIVPGRRARD